MTYIVKADDGRKAIYVSDLLTKRQLSPDGLRDCMALGMRTVQLNAAHLDSIPDS